MHLTVLSVAFPFAPVGPVAVGGAEQILSTLDCALHRARHVSLVVACEGSRPAGSLFHFSMPHGKVLEKSDQIWCRNQVQRAIDRALASHPVDLIHMHGLDFYEYTLPAEIPVLVTLHLPIAWYPADKLKRFHNSVHFCCVSESQRLSCPPELRNSAVIENGTPLPPFEHTPRADFALVLGRICPEKNGHAALEAGNIAGTRVLLGGQVFPYHEHLQYFAEKIEPVLRRSPGNVEHEFLGPLEPDRRQRLLSSAKCLLHPTLAPETSSLVAMEALAAGTPVIAYRSGALPQIVEHGVTGFLVDSVEEMADALGKVHTISSEACRRAAEQRFSSERMVSAYLQMYRSILYEQNSGRMHG